MVDLNDLNGFQGEFRRFLFSTNFEVGDEFLQWLDVRTGDDTNFSRMNCGLGVYRNNVMYSLTEALATQFPIVQKLVGTDFFRALAGDYVRQQPPRHPTLSNYGDQFAAFIAAAPACKNLAYLADVATLEWLCQQALHAADAPMLHVDRLASMPTGQPGDAVFFLQPSAALMVSSYPVYQIWVSNLDDTGEQIHLAPQHTDYLLVYRRDLEVQVVALKPEAFALLRQLQQGQSLGRACFFLMETHALDMAELTPLITYLLGLDVFSHIEPTLKETI